jgi:predicted DNA-binding protein YlxM (UPF0122 family)
VPTTGIGEGRTVNDPTERDEFDRIRLHQEIERTRTIIVQYEKGLAFYRREIENKRYEIGRPDERLGDGA